MDLISLIISGLSLTNRAFHPSFAAFRAGNLYRLAEHTSAAAYRASLFHILYRFIKGVHPIEFIVILKDLFLTHLMSGCISAAFSTLISFTVCIHKSTLIITGFTGSTIVDIDSLALLMGTVLTMLTVDLYRLCRTVLPIPIAHRTND